MRITILMKLLALFFVVTIIPLAILGVFSMKDAEKIGNEVTQDARSLGDLAVQNARESNTEIIGDSLERLGVRIAEGIVDFLSEREADALLLAELSAGKAPAQIQDMLLGMTRAKTEEVWYNTGSDLEPVEFRATIPIYSQAAFIDAQGNEVVKIVDGQISSMRADVSDPANTEFKTEDYFHKTSSLQKGEVYVSRLNTWYISEAELRSRLPDEYKERKTWDDLPGRDRVKEGNMRFATPVYHEGIFQGIIVLSVDYQHIQKLSKHIDPATDQRVVSTPYEANYILMFDDQGSTIVHPKPNNIRGYLADGTLEHPNTVDTPGGIFNLQYYDKGDAYQKMFASVKAKEPLITASTDVSGRNKMTVTVPIIYDKGEYAEHGIFGGIMMSVNTDRFYEKVEQTENFLSTEIAGTERQMKERIESMQSRTILLLLITIISVTILGTLFARSITGPIKELKDVADRITSGDFGAKLPLLKGTDEIVELTGSMEMMILPLRQKAKK